MSPITGQVKEPEPDYSREEYLAKTIVQELGALLLGRSQDLPHRFRAPAAFAQYMQNWGVNSTFHSVPIMGNNSSMYMTMQMTTRPTQHIFEIIFQGADGMRLFTLEIEYGDAIQETREVLLSWRAQIH